MAKKTKVQICQDALTILGIEESISNIDTPNTVWEKRCAMFCDVARETMLTELMPSFAITPEPIRITQNTNKQFPVPSDSLRVLFVDGKSKEFHEIGGTIKCDFITTKPYIEVIYIKNEKDTGLFSAFDCYMWAVELAIRLAPLTKNKDKMNYAQNVLMQQRSEYAGVNAQKIKINKKSKRPFIGMGWFYR